MDFNFDAILSVVGPILAVAIGAALIKKAIGLAITLVAILIIAYIVSQSLGANVFPF